MKNTQEKINGEQFESYVKTALSEAPSFNVTSDEIIRIHSQKGHPSPYYRFNLFMSKKIYIPVGVIGLMAFAIVFFGTGRNDSVAKVDQPVVPRGGIKVAEVASNNTSQSLEIRNVVAFDGSGVIDAIVDDLFSAQNLETIDSLAVIDSYGADMSFSDIDSMVSDITNITI